jgi:hypothetical protein
MTRAPSLAFTLPIVSLFACTVDPATDTPVGATTEAPGPGTDLPAGPEALCQVNVACGGNILGDPKTPCTVEIVDAAGVTSYAGAAGLELRGRSSLYFPKPQYAMELRTHSELPVWPGSTWSYVDDGSITGTTWRTVGYDDSSWQAGPAPLGHGEGYLQTELAAPSSGALTTWFRAEFTPAARSSITHLDLGLDSHDGAAVYLNGVEVLRHNLAADATAETPADSEVPELPTGSPWTEIAVDPALLVDGANVLAVEVHRASLESVGTRFDLYLEASGDDAATDLFGMGKEGDWILNGQYMDRSLYRNRLAYDLFQSLGGSERYATETVFCELELDGEYMGLYTLGEKIERDDDRVDIASGEAPGDTFIVKLDDVDGFHDNAVGYGTWQMVHPDLDPVSEASVSATLSDWEAAVLGADPGDPETGIFASLDLDSAVDWVLINELAKNPDAYRLSVHLWRDQGGKMFFAPWDLDLSMGYPVNDCGAAGWNPRTWLTLDGEVRDLAFVQQMAAVPAFRDALAARWTALRADELSDEVILARIDAYEATLAPGFEANAARWPIEDIAFGGYGISPDAALCPVDSYEAEQDRTREFLVERLAWMDDNIATF